VGERMDLEQLAAIDDVLLLLDIITILLVDNNPLLGIVLVGLLKAVTNDRATKIALILLIIVVNVGMR
jgi:hypothetical protein